MHSNQSNSVLPQSFFGFCFCWLRFPESTCSIRSRLRMRIGLDSREERIEEEERIFRWEVCSKISVNLTWLMIRTIFKQHKMIKTLIQRQLLDKKSIRNCFLHEKSNRSADIFCMSISHLFIQGWNGLLEFELWIKLLCNTERSRRSRNDERIGCVFMRKMRNKTFKNDHDRSRKLRIFFKWFSLISVCENNCENNIMLNLHLV